MATEYFLYAGNEIVDQVEVKSSDRDFFNLIREIKSSLSDAGKSAFVLLSEYDVFEGGAEGSLSPCSHATVSEIESAWFC